MDLKSLSFIAEIVIFLAVYFILAGTDLQKWLILCVSLYILWRKSSYAGTAVAALLCLVVWLISGQIQKCRKEKPKIAAIWLKIGLIADLGVLLYFKFFTNIFDAFRISLQENSGIDLPELLAPMGIAYFALSMAAYLYDVAHKKVDAETNYFRFLTYALYFPALLEGPFNLYKNLMPQLKKRHLPEWDRFVDGLQRILWGYFKKMVIADRIGIFVMAVLGDETASGWLVFFTMALYSFQIYGDFSGGIDIMMGISHIMGIDLAENFKAPFIAKNVTEYWQRWHMTLGTIMEKYLYYPIVLSKRMRNFTKMVRNKYLSRVIGATLANFIVFVFVGIWHGTGWNYVVYGIYQAIFTSSAILLGPLYKKWKAGLHITDKTPVWRIFCIVRTFVILTFGRYLIKAAGLTQAFALYKRTFSVWNPEVLYNGTLLNYELNERNWIVLTIAILILLAVDILNERGICIREKIRSQILPVRFLIYYVGIFAIIIFGVYGAAYDASSFIYAQF